LSGSASLIHDIRADLRAEGIPSAIQRHDTATLFDWLVAALSYQGISNQVAAEYIERDGSAAQDSKATGTFTIADTSRSAGPVQSLITLMPVPCPPISCATGGSTRWPTRYSCSFAILPVATWSVGSTGNSKVPMT
jgi:hypothetical protein